MFVNTHRHRKISTTSPKVNFMEFHERIEDDNLHRFRSVFKFDCKECVYSFIPFAKWIRTYPWKAILIRDFVSGLTVSVLQVPQGLAYAQLAGCPPAVGLYMAIFPCITYALLSTSKHVSFGPMAIVCLMTDAIITDAESYSNLSRIEIGTAITFVVGMWLVLMYIVRIGKICSLLSATFVSSFNSGVSVHVFTSQVKELLGIKIKRYYAVHSIVDTYIAVANRLTEINFVSFGIGVSTIVLLKLYDAFVKTRLLKRGIILPVEFFLMVIATLISYLANFKERFNVRVLGYVPHGIPPPKVPPMEMIPELILPSSMVALVSFFLTVSIAQYFASMRKYKVDSQQELVAQTFGQFLGSFFQCLPASGSVSRSAVQEAAGGETQLSSMFAVVIVILVVLFLADLLDPIPQTMLAGIIISSVLSIFKKTIQDLKNIWFISRHEFFLWFVIFLTVVFVKLDVGLGGGLLISLMVNILHSSDPQVHLVGRVRVSGEHYIYVRLRQELGSEIVGIKIIQINGPVNFVTRDHIQKKVNELTGVDPAEVMKRVEQSKDESTDETIVREDMTTVPFKQGNPTPNVASMTSERLQFIVLDTTTSPHVDYTGMVFLEELVRAYDEVGVGVVVVSRKARVSKHHHLPTVVSQLEAAVSGAVSGVVAPGHSVPPSTANVLPSREDNI